MNIEQILNSDTEFVAADLRAASNGLYVDEEYKGRKVQLRKTENGYVVTITNPDMGFFTNRAEDVIRRIKNELSNLRRKKMSRKSKRN